MLLPHEKGFSEENISYGDIYLSLSVVVYYQSLRRDWSLFIGEGREGGEGVT